MPTVLTRENADLANGEYRRSKIQNCHSKIQNFSHIFERLEKKFNKTSGTTPSKTKKKKKNWGKMSKTIQNL